MQNKINELIKWLNKECEPEYRNLLILDKHNSVEIEDNIYPRNSIDPFMKSSLCFYVMPNGGLKCLKDRYDYYGRDNIFFGL